MSQSPPAQRGLFDLYVLRYLRQKPQLPISAALGAVMAVAIASATPLRLATALLEDSLVLRARVRVEKPEAAAAGAAAAGVEFSLSRS